MFPSRLNKAILPFWLNGPNFQVQSNAILTLERRKPDSQIATQRSSSADAEVCVSKIGFIIALIITALLALVAVAIAVSCWLMAYRKRPKTAGPLPHPPEFPNPLFTTPEPLAEPTPDYLHWKKTFYAKRGREQMCQKRKKKMMLKNSFSTKMRNGLRVRNVLSRSCSLSLSLPSTSSPLLSLRRRRSKEVEEKEEGETINGMKNLKMHTCEKKLWY